MRQDWFKRRVLPALLSCALFLMSASAWARDEDENMPLSEQDKAHQLTAFAIIGVIVLLGVGFYYFRRWQTLHSGNVVHGNEQDED